MTRKAFLIKILPVIITFVLVISVILAVTSCSKSKNIPYGTLTDQSVYATYGDQSISEKALYDEMRYSAYNYLNEEINKIIFAEDVSYVRSNFVQFYDEFQDLIDTEIFGVTDDKAILEMEDKDVLLTKYYDSLYKSGITNINTSIDPYDDVSKTIQEPIIDYYILSVAQKNYARKLLLDAVETDDAYEITASDIATSYNTMYKNKDTVEAIVIKFNSSVDLTASLKALHLKFYKGELYRVFAESGVDYDDTYDDFEAASDTPLNEIEVLFEFARIYNFIYPYKDKQFSILDQASAPIIMSIEGVSDPLAQDALITQTQYDYINEQNETKALRDAFIADLLDQVLDNPETTYSYNDMTDTKVRDHIFTTLSWEDDEKSCYSTSAQSATKGYFLAYKFDNANDLEYEVIRDLALYEKGLTEGKTTELIPLYNALKSALSKLLVGKTDEEIKLFLFGNEVTDGLADTIDAINIVETHEGENSKTDPDSIWTTIFNDKLTKEYITEKTSEKVNETEIIFYDSLYELFHVMANTNYKKTNAKSPDGNAVASVKINDVTTYINLTGEDGLYQLLEQKMGSTTAFVIAYREILKNRYYAQITEEEFETYQEEFDSYMAYFTQGQFNSYGMPSSIGKTAFMQAYFKGETVDECIFKNWVVTRLDELFVKDGMAEVFPNVYTSFAELAEIKYNEYFKLTYDSIRIYTDDDEDGVADDPNTSLRKAEVETLVAELIQKIYDEFNRPSYDQTTGFKTIIDSYNDSPRIQTVSGIPAEGYLSQTDWASLLWSEYKREGIFIEYTSGKSAERSLATSTKFSDEILKEQVALFFDYIKDIDLGSGQFVCRMMEEDDLGTSLDVPNTATLIGVNDGYHVFFYEQVTDPSSAEFRPTNNPVNGTSKLYPYDISEENPRPEIEELEPGIYPTTSLYNNTEIPTANQIEVFIREFNSDLGVLSFSTSVRASLKAFVQPIYENYYIAQTFDSVILYNLVTNATNSLNYANDTRDAQLANLVLINEHELFDYEVNAFSTAWWDAFSTVNE